MSLKVVFSKSASSLNRLLLKLVVPLNWVSSKEASLSNFADMKSVVLKLAPKKKALPLNVARLKPASLLNVAHASGLCNLYELRENFIYLCWDDIIRF
jgi:hypothetical protein